MAKVHKPVFGQNPLNWVGIATDAVGDLNTDAPTGTILLGTAPDEGVMITKLTALTRGTNTASAAYMFLSRDGGATKTLVRTVLIPAHTVEPTTEIPMVDFGFTETEPFRLEQNVSVYVGLGVALADGVAFSCEVTDYAGE